MMSHTKWTRKEGGKKGNKRLMGVVAWQISHTTTSLSLGIVRIEPHSPQKCTLRACVWKTRFQLCGTLIVSVHTRVELWLL